MLSLIFILFSFCDLDIAGPTDYTSLERFAREYNRYAEMLNNERFVVDVKQKQIRDKQWSKVKEAWKNVH